MITYSIYDYMEETARIVDRVTAINLDYLKDMDARWINHNPQLYDAVSDLPLIRQGKKARQTLVRLAFESVSDEDWEKGGIVPSIASAVELLATSTYTIDDILDEQPERYDKEATWKKFGLNLGILAGYLQDNIARRTLRNGIETLDDRLKVKILDLYDAIIREVNEGQVLNEFMKEGTITEQYLERTYKATGIHWENPAMMGALVGNASDKELKFIGGIGMNFGMVYFLRNDLFNYIPQEVIRARNARALKRTSYEDLRKGLWTYPIIWLMENGNEDEKNEFREKLGRKDLSEQELIEATLKLIESDAVSATIDLMDNYRKKARDKIRKLRESKAKKLLFIFDNMFDNAKEYVDEFKRIGIKK